jgi:hypothetical protein
MLCLQHGFYNIIFKIKHKLYIASEVSPSPPPPPKGHFWVRICTQLCCAHDLHVGSTGGCGAAHSHRPYIAL